MEVSLIEVNVDDRVENPLHLHGLVPVLGRSLLAFGELGLGGQPSHAGLGCFLVHVDVLCGVLRLLEEVQV